MKYFHWTKKLFLSFFYYLADHIVSGAIIPAAISVHQSQYFELTSEMCNMRRADTKYWHLIAA